MFSPALFNPAMICPVCMGTAAMVAAGATSSGGFAVLAVRLLNTKKRKTQPPSAPAKPKAVSEPRLTRSR